ncbi:response regulator transcription factor [Mesorhizobium sp. YC-39]|uniref:LuxR C-terminal-related transcriptional regulator n=1 Tax=unclassified Mesorhizobium TaxID=325217 RepID=UPI0021E95707|nr:MULTISPECIES: response regulator transcription factor [unclassified Mesorhizobium]MCV3206751.1 response regulator transcription factor [Mesorhizobium sp. YC-2]MCV3226849.1 response regulator transcription factor [Mesorhizobium sp. YC-39]
MSAVVRITVVDDHPLFREGVSRSLREIGGFEIVGEGATAADAERLAQIEKPDVMLLDISMPGGGLRAAANILAKDPDQKIVILTVSEANADLALALRTGVRGYVLKGVRSSSLAEILKSIAAGEKYVSPMLSAQLLNELIQPRKVDLVDQLSDREIGILELVAEGLSNKEAAKRLFLQEKTIKHHMTRILAKLKVRNRTEAALLLYESKTKAS